MKLNKMKGGLIFTGKNKVSDYKKVVTVANKYVEGCREGKSDIMYGCLNGELNAGSMKTYMECRSI